MPRFSFVVLANPREGRDDDFDRWADEHLDEMLGVHGVVKAQRFRYVDSLDRQSPWRYLTVYEWEAESVDEALDALEDARARGVFHVSDALDREGRMAWFFEPVGEPHMVTDLSET